MAALRLNKSITLIELLITIVLFSIIVLSFSSIDLFSRRQLLNLERQSTLQNELSILIAHMSKNIQKATGTFVDFPININAAAPGGPLMTIYLDSNGDGLRDKQVAYRWDNLNYQVKYYDNYGSSPGSLEVIANKIRSFTMSLPNGSKSHYVELNAIACWQPGQPVSYYTNPCNKILTRVTMHSVSLN
ncbi:MAG: hypothetical protein H8D90_01000 [Candidatus Omnitrophica bacterium]|nr:hypothetical protein [Candidatus Omnitrophota bacterium]MBL7151607.1 hypothetical protein [Candidatus Omnitrophota bacterium]